MLARVLQRGRVKLARNQLAARSKQRRPDRLPPAARGFNGQASARWRCGNGAESGALSEVPRIFEETRLAAGGGLLKMVDVVGHGCTDDLEGVLGTICLVDRHLRRLPRC